MSNLKDESIVADASYQSDSNDKAVHTLTDYDPNMSASKNQHVLQTDYPVPHDSKNNSSFEHEQHSHHHHRHNGQNKSQDLTGDATSTFGFGNDAGKALSISQGVYRALQGNGGGFSRGRASHSAGHQLHNHSKLISRRSSHMHRSSEQFSSQYSAEAEAKFFTLMEYITSASREASSFKTLWSKLTSERSSWTSEREELFEEIEELYAELERREFSEAELRREWLAHGNEIERLKTELTVIVKSTSEQKQKHIESHEELESYRHRQTELQTLLTRAKADHARLVGEIEVLQTEKLNFASERLSFREESEKRQSELDELHRELHEVRHRREELTERLDVLKEEIRVSTSRYRELQLERDSIFAENERLSEELRLAIRRMEEKSTSLTEITEQKTRLHKEYHQLKETLRRSDEEHTSSLSTIETLRAELRTKHTSFEDLEARVQALNLKLGHSKRDIITKDERILELEAELSRLRIRVESRDEEHRTLLTERDELREERDHIRREHQESSRRVVEIETLLATREKAWNEARVELARATEQVTIIERARDELHEKFTRISTEKSLLQTEVESIKIELHTVNNARDQHRGEANEYEERLSTFTETITRYEEETAQLEIELKSMRSVLREAREQKERAIAARNAADRERDEAIAQYEKKCREMEILEDNRSASLLSFARRSESRATMTRIASGESRSTMNRIASGSMRSDFSAL